MAREFLVKGEIVVRAPADRCFLLSTSVALVEKELGMHPVSGRTSGLVSGGDTVLWKGWQLGLPQFHESQIEDFDAPRFFRDRMISGRFRTFHHDHNFLDRHNGTVVLQDELRFTMPLGVLGAMVGQVILVPHVRGLIHRRFAMIKRIAESDEWRRYLPAPEGRLSPETVSQPGLRALT